MTDPHEIVSSRSFDAPRDAVFRAFSDPQALSQWWGPRGYTNTFHEFDFRTGGTWRLVMHAPDGNSYPMTKQFVEVTSPERIVLLHPEPPEHRFTMTVTLQAEDQRTRVTWHLRFDSAQEVARVGAFIKEANEQNFDRLAALLASSGAP
ncbi:activator of HSP90 ATPase [Chondromyces crocatus]|uniref:Activator of HSP90 ATPase n=2 Tax=Chondromyces crocatus TaxID=52 RepID=A0A0K1EPJ5_CHOCO|nr:activator of HSP90 ATPase [Chondromyces crocatus]